MTEAENNTENQQFFIAF